MEAMVSRPGSSAASLFPEAASANRSIFYRSGRPATVAEVHANLQRTAGEGAPAAGAASPEPAPLDADARDRALAARLDRLKQEQALLQMLLGQPGDGGKSAGFGDAFIDRT